MGEKISLQRVIAHCKAYGFVYNSSEIYGGLQAVYDYGPYGALLKRRLQDFWWRTMTGLHADVVGLDAAILMAPATWQASGHVDGFHDWLVDHRGSKRRYRVDVLLEDAAGKLREAGRLEEADVLLTDMADMMVRKDGAGLTGLLCRYGVVCAVAGTADWTVAREFNLMLSTQLGAVAGASEQVFLRPETAQGIFVHFMQIQKTARMRVPFGVAQIGKAFRNEIVARQFIFRMREFEQMEMQFFVPPEEAEGWFDYWLAVRRGWYEVLGMTDIRVKAHEQLAHYAAAAVDIEYGFPFGYKELEGVHNRTDFDLKSHGALSKKQLRYFDAQRGEHFVPYVIETSVGCDRLVLMLLCAALCEEKVGDGLRTYLRLPPALAPIHAAVLPLMKKPKLAEVAKALFNKLCYGFSLVYEDRGSVGKRYTQQDLLGTPYCITVDFDTLEDKCVTVRDRDTMKQGRIRLEEVEAFLRERVLLDGLLKKMAVRSRQIKMP